METDIPRAIQLISIDEDTKKLKIHDEAINIIKNIQGPVGVIAVCGKYRTGKSYLLNKIISPHAKTDAEEIKSPEELGFKVGPTINACTKGILIWSKPVQIQHQGRQLSCVILDSEGIGCINTKSKDDQESQMIFLLTVLLSSYFIYNSVGTIDETIVQNLSFITTLGTQILDAKSPPSNFLWVVRDFALKLTDTDGQPISPKDYLEHALKDQKELTQNNASRNKIRKALREYFPARDCVTLVRPVEDEALLRTLNTLSEEHLRPEFARGIKTVRDKIFGDVQPK